MNRVKEILALQGIEISDAALQTLEQYMKAILSLNEAVNLTAITDRDEFIEKHYLDSLLCAGEEAMAEATQILDIGTGAGFPGVPLAVVFPEKEFVLVDSLKKRITILQRLCEQLGIHNVKAIHGRAEELARDKTMREQFDLCVSRAVANMRTLSEYCLPFLRIGGTFIAYKGPDCDEEVAEAAKAIEILGGTDTLIKELRFEGVPFEHTLVLIKKENATPKAYPRKAGTPSKKPL
ncbi:MAG: 16S rRNA (guanine(527)-N(7))-methyltransferase RsmG [Firmicutes bacterium]|nr:16S rRNA (guanine(527)-N(7))-methyltransferase RsmG [Bacillota bacterium]